MALAMAASPCDVVGQDRLLEPADVVVLEAAAHRDGLLGVVAVVGVDEDLDVVADGLAHGRQPPQSSASDLPKSLATFILTRGMPRST